MPYAVYMAEYYYDVEFKVKGRLTSDEYRLMSNLLNTLVDEFDLELVESELE